MLATAEAWCNHYHAPNEFSDQLQQEFNAYSQEMINRVHQLEL